MVSESAIPLCGMWAVGHRPRSNGGLALATAALTLRGPRGGSGQMLLLILFTPGIQPAQPSSESNPLVGMGGVRLSILISGQLHKGLNS